MQNLVEKRGIEDAKEIKKVHKEERKSRKYCEQLESESKQRRGPHV